MRLRSLLDRLYSGSLWLSAACMVFMGVILLAQIVARPFGIVVPSASELAAYAMAASTFLALAPVMRLGQHIRVQVLIDRSPARLRHAIDLWTSGFTAAVIGYFASYCAAMTWDSFDYGEMSPGLLPIAIWIPQSAMTLGLLLMTVACVEDVVHLVRGRQASYAALSEAASTGTTSVASE